MSRIFVAGIGAVSPAGWSVAALAAALKPGAALPVHAVDRPGSHDQIPARLVPAPSPRPPFLAHPRLRRASPVSHYAAAAALAAVAPLRAKANGRKLRLGTIACLQSGCVQYSCRFYAEALANPATASPLIFPETVYAAPASHVAALLEEVVLANSLIGDPAAYLQGLALGAEWLALDRVDACVVFGAEEIHWMIADALQHLDRTAIAAAGSGALCLCRDEAWSLGIELAAITDAYTFSAACRRPAAALAVRRHLAAGNSSELLVDSLGSRGDAAERAAWQDWPGARLSPKRVLGEGMMAAAAWQCVLAVNALSLRECAAAQVSMVGSNQQAIGARFIPARAT